MNRAKSAAMGAAMLTLLLAIAGCEPEGAAKDTSVAPLSSEATAPDDAAQVTAPPAKSSPSVLEAPADTGLNIAAGTPEEAVKGCTELGLTAEDVAPAGFELARDSTYESNKTLCVYRITGQQNRVHQNFFTVGVFRGMAEGTIYTIPESYEMFAKISGVVPVALGDKAAWSQSVEKSGAGESFYVLKGEKMIAMLGNFDTELFPQGLGQEFYTKLAEKLLPDL